MGFRVRSRPWIQSPPSISCVTPGKLLIPREAQSPRSELEKKASTVGLMRRLGAQLWESSWFLPAVNGGSFPTVHSGDDTLMGSGPKSTSSNPTLPFSVHSWASSSTFLSLFQCVQWGE